MEPSGREMQENGKYAANWQRDAGKCYIGSSVVERDRRVANMEPSGREMQGCGKYGAKRQRDMLHVLPMLHDFLFG